MNSWISNFYSVSDSSTFFREENIFCPNILETKKRIVGK